MNSKPSNVWVRLLTTLGRCVLVWLLLGSFVSGWATTGFRSPGNLVHQQWHAQEGLPAETVQALTRSHEGYIWIGTQGGLARYDGHRFVLFHPKNTPVLRSQDIKSLAADEGEGLWIGTGRGLYHQLRGQFRAITEAGLPQAVVRSLLQARNGALYVGTTTGLWVIQNNQVTALPSPGGETLEIFNLAESSRGEIAVNTSHGLFCVKEVKLTRSAGPPVPWQFRAVRFDRGDRLWLGGRSGLWFRSAEGFKQVPIQGVPSRTVVTELYEDTSRTLWVATGQGLGKIPMGSLPASLKLDHSIPSVMAWAEDSEGGLWLGTWGKGLHRLHVGRVTVMGAPEGLASSYALGLLESRDGAVWLGTGNGLTRVKGSQVRSWGLDEGLVDATVQALHEDEDGVVWVGCAGALARMEGGRPRDSGFGRHGVFALETDGAGGLWVGTWSGLFHIPDRRASKVRAQPVEGLDLHMVWLVHRARDGALWLAGERAGLTRMHGTTRQAYLPPTVPTEPFISVYEQDEATLWFGTAGAGVLRYKGGRFNRIDAAHGLPDDVIYAMVPDGKDGLWMSSNHGVFRVGLQALNAAADGLAGALAVDTLGVADGMRSAECNGTVGKAGIKARDGRLWFPTTDGVAIIDPKQSPVGSAPPVVIEEVLVSRKQVAFDRALSLHPGQGEVEIRFSAITFGSHSEAPLRYRLEGFDEEWRESSGERSARYTNLPPGQYVFRLESFAKGPRGGMSEPEARLAILLPPRWYQRRWVLGLAVLAGFGLTMTAHWMRIRRIRARARVRQADLRKAVDEALGQVKILQGLLPVCAWCRSVRSDEGFWQQIESYITQHSEATFTHSICPDCAHKMKDELRGKPR